MKEIFLLTKILFKSSATQFNTNNKKNKVFGKVFFYILIYLYLAGLIGYISYESIKVLMYINKEYVFINICLSAMLIFYCIQTIITSLNVLFFSKDLELLLPLPVKPEKIVAAKFNTLIISQYIISTIVLLPMMIVYAILLNLNIMFYVMSLLVLILFPIIPVILTIFITTIIMKFTNIIRNKDVVQYLTIFITFILIIGIQFIFGNPNSELTDQDMANKLVQTNSTIETYSKFFITIKPAMNALLNFDSIKGFVNIGILLVETIAVYIVVLLVISKTYLKTALSVATNRIKKKSNSKEKKEKEYDENNILLAYVKKEFKNLNRNPIFFMQCVLPALLFPLIFCIPMYLSLRNVGTGEIESLFASLSNIINSSYGLLGGLVVVLFFFMFNFSTVAAISRDGENSVFMKYIPIDYSKQILYKIIPGILINIFPIFYVLILSKILIKNFSINIILFIMFISMIINIFNNFIMIIIDLKHPKLKWITEYAVVKQNFNIFFAMIISIIEIIGLIILRKYVQDLYLYGITLILLFTILNIVILNYINKNKLKLFAKIN